MDRIKNLILTFIICIFGCYADDIIIFKSNKKLVGTVLSYKDGKLKIQDKSGKIKIGPITSIKSIKFDTKKFSQFEGVESKTTRKYKVMKKNPNKKKYRFNEDKFEGVTNIKNKNWFEAKALFYVHMDNAGKKPPKLFFKLRMALLKGQAIRVRQIKFIDLENRPNTIDVKSGNIRIGKSSRFSQEIYLESKTDLMQVDEEVQPSFLHSVALTKSEIRFTNGKDNHDYSPTKAERQMAKDILSIFKTLNK